MKINNLSKMQNCISKVNFKQDIDRAELVSRELQSYLTLNPPVEDSAQLMEQFVYGTPFFTDESYLSEAEKIRLEYISEEAKARAEARMYGITPPAPQTRNIPPSTIAPSRLDVKA